IPRARFWGLHAPLSALHDRLLCCCFPAPSAAPHHRPHHHPSSSLTPSSSLPAAVASPAAAAAAVAGRDAFPGARPGSSEGGVSASVGSGAVGSERGSGREAGEQRQQQQRRQEDARRQCQEGVVSYLLAVRQQWRHYCVSEQEQQGVDSLLLHLLLALHDAPRLLMLCLPTAHNRCYL
ncbi:unnamed protein product, partial [Closterium sp. NIES-54]